METNYFYYCSVQAMNRMLTSYSLPKHNYQTPLSKRFPEDIQCIIFSKNPESGSLYISNIEAAENPLTLKKFRIKAILSCAKGYQLKHDKINVPYYKYIPTIDHQACDISPHFDQAIDFISNNLKKTNVLVHCIAGVSRSVSMVIAYLIKQQNMTYQQAYRYVKSRRNIINPNEGFVKQLKIYHTILSKRNMTESKTTSLQVISNQQPIYNKYEKSDQKTIATRGYQQIEELARKQKDRYSSKNYEEEYSQFQRTYTKDEPTSNRYVRENAELSYSQTKIKHTQEETIPNRYYSPNKLMNRQQSIGIKNPYAYDRTYYRNLNSDLDEKIKQIKEKYDSHRRQLQEKYQNISNTGYKQNLRNNIYMPQQIYRNRNNQSFNLKTQAYERYPKNIHFSNPVQYNLTTTDNREKLYAKEFYPSNSKKQIQKYRYNEQVYSGPLNNSRYRHQQSPKYKHYDMTRTFNGNYVNKTIEHPMVYRKYY